MTTHTHTYAHVHTPTHPHHHTHTHTDENLGSLIQACTTVRSLTTMACRFSHEDTIKVTVDMDNQCVSFKINGSPVTVESGDIWKPHFSGKVNVYPYILFDSENREETTARVTFSKQNIMYSQ